MQLAEILQEEREETQDSFIIDSDEKANWALRKIAWARREHKRQTDNMIYPQDILFSEFLKAWFVYFEGKVQSSTYESYRMALNTNIIPFFESINVAMCDLTQQHIQRFCDEKMKTHSVCSVRKFLANISKCLDYAIKHNLVTSNYSKTVELPTKTPYTGAKTYNETQIQRLLTIAKGDPLEIVILLALVFGLRRSEVLGLKWSAIDFEHKTITINHTVVKAGNLLHKKDITKNKSSFRTYPLPTAVEAKLLMLKEQQNLLASLQPNDYESEGYVCVDARGTLLKTGYISKHFHVLLERNKLEPIRFHDLRHSSATYLRSLGFSMRDIKEWLGHADICTTMNIYTHLDIEDKKIISEKLSERLSFLDS